MSSESDWLTRGSVVLDNQYCGCLQQFELQRAGKHAFTLQQLMSIRQLYPNLVHLRLEDVSGLIFDRHSTLTMLPFRQLRSLIVINCALKCNADDDETDIMNTWCHDLANEFKELRELRWDGLPLEDEHLEKMLRGGLPRLKRLTLVSIRGFDEGCGPLTNKTLENIAKYKPDLRQLGLQIWEDLDVTAIVDMLSVCKQLTGFEIHGKIDGKDLFSKFALKSLRAIMKAHGVKCPFKILPKFITTLQHPIQFDSL